MTRTITICFLMTCTLVVVCASMAPAGLVAHYRLDELAGSTTADDAVGQHPAIYEGTPGFNRPGAATGTGTSILFNGDDAVTDPNPNLPGMSAFSISMWLNINSGHGGHHMPASRTNDFNDPWTIQIEPGSGDTRTLTWIEGFVNHVAVTVATDEWFYVAITTPGTAGGTQSMYINGALAATGTDPDGFHDDGSQLFWIGRRADGFYYRGGIDDVQVYDHELSADDAGFLFNNPGQTITTDPPVQAGDFDNDGDVDGADFVVWQTHFPTSGGATLADGDADADGDVDGADFVVWQTNFPFTPSPGISPVPEPQAVVLAAIGVAVLVGVRKRKSRGIHQR